MVNTAMVSFTTANDQLTKKSFSATTHLPYCISAMRFGDYVRGGGGERWWRYRQKTASNWIENAVQESVPEKPLCPRGAFVSIMIHSATALSVD